MDNEHQLTLAEIVTYLLEFYGADEIASLVGRDEAPVDAGVIERWATSDYAGFDKFWHREAVRRLWDAQEILLRHFGGRGAARVVFFNRRGSLDANTLADLARSGLFTEFISRLNMTLEGRGIYAAALSERERSLMTT